MDRVLIFRPDFLYMERPTRGIDIYSEGLILKWAPKINQKYSTTVVMTSGELEGLVCIRDGTMVIYQGKIYKVFKNDIGPEELTLTPYGRKPDEVQLSESSPNHHVFIYGSLAGSDVSH